eukprot:m51a1_g11494 hypothetical protein (171) ;mRNA; f:16367-18587
MVEPLLAEPDNTVCDDCFQLDGSWAPSVCDPSRECVSFAITPKRKVFGGINLCLCIDISGSMTLDLPLLDGMASTTSRLASVVKFIKWLVSQSGLMVDNLDSLCIVTFSEAASVVFSSADLSGDKRALFGALDVLSPQTGTNLEQGILTSIEAISELVPQRPWNVNVVLA